MLASLAPLLLLLAGTIASDAEDVASLRATFPRPDPACAESTSVLPCGNPILDRLRTFDEAGSAEHGPCVPSSWRPVDRSAVGAPDRIADVICDAYSDTEHFRIHFSTRPSRLSLDAPGRDLAVDGDVAYVALDTLGLLCVDVSDPRLPREAAALGVGGRAEAVSVSGSHAYVATENGLVVVDVTVPSAPALVASVPVTVTRSLADGDWLYAAGGDTLYVLDVSMPAAAGVVARLPVGSEALDLSLHDASLLLGTDDGLTRIDVSTPTAPEAVAVLSLPGSVRALGVGGGHAYAVGYVPEERESVLWSIDLSDPTEMTLVATTALDGAFSDILVNGEVAYVVDSRVIQSIRISLPDSPWLGARDGSIGPSHGMARVGDVVYVLDSRGLEIVDLLEPLYPRLVDDRLPGWPDLSYVETLGDALEAAYARYHEDLGLRLPVSDGDRGGGTDLVDCYIYRLEYSTWGFARWELSGGGSCPGYSGFFTLHTSRIPTYITPAEVALHEYFHVVQFAHGLETTWFMESTASWAPFAVWPDSVSWLWGTRDWFDTPHLPLWEPGPHSREYGGVHYWLFQEQITDPFFVPDVWARSCKTSWLEALHETLADRGLAFDPTLVTFSIWNALTDARDDGQHHAYGAALPEVRIHATHETYPVVNATLDAAIVAREAGSNYVRFVGPGVRERLVVSLDGDPATVDGRAISFVASTRDGRHTEWTRHPDAEGDVTFELEGWPEHVELTMIVTNFADPAGGLAFVYSAREEGAAAVPLVLGVTPNPTRAGARFVVRTPGSLPVSLVLYDVGGRVVRRIFDDTLPRGLHTLTWDGVRENRNPTPAGIYFYDLRIGDRRVTDRLVRLR